MVTGITSQPRSFCGTQVVLARNERAIRAGLTIGCNNSRSAMLAASRKSRSPMSLRWRWPTQNLCRPAYARRCYGGSRSLPSARTRVRAGPRIVASTGLRRFAAMAHRAPSIACHARLLATVMPISLAVDICVTVRAVAGSR